MMIPRHEYVSGAWNHRPVFAIIAGTDHLWHGQLRIKSMEIRGLLHHFASRSRQISQERPCVEVCSNKELCNTRSQIYIICMEIWWNMVGCLMLLPISCFNVESVRELDFIQFVVAMALCQRGSCCSVMQTLWWQKKRKRCWKNVAGRSGTNVLMMTTRIITDLHVLFRVVSYV